VRTPLLRQGVLVEGESYERTIVVRRAAAYAFDAGRRLDVPLEGATVVVRAHTRRAAREAAGALEGVNNSLTREDPLPGVDPERTTAGCSVFDDEAPLIEASLEEALGLEGPHLLECGRSLSVARTEGIDDAHDCVTGTAGGEPSFWCVLSRGKELVAGAMAQSCEAAVLAGAVDRPLSETATLGWGSLAGSLCEPHLARVPEVIASMAGQRAVHDLSYVWEVMGVRSGARGRPSLRARALARGGGGPRALRSAERSDQGRSRPLPRRAEAEGTRRSTAHRGRDRGARGTLPDARRSAECAVLVVAMRTVGWLFTSGPTCVNITSYRG
jgi:hypothetical protein